MEITLLTGFKIKSAKDIKDILDTAIENGNSVSKAEYFKIGQNVYKNRFLGLTFFHIRSGICFHWSISIPLMILLLLVDGILWIILGAVIIMGHIVYRVGVIIKSLGFLMKLDPQSARGELSYLINDEYDF